MGLFIYITGLLLLLHAGYSSFEFHQLLKTTHHMNLQNNNLPIDIVVEVILGIIIVISGSISSISNPDFLSIDNELVKPQSKYLKQINMKDATSEFEKLQINPFEELESRVEFIDIIKKRKQYREWSTSK